jgi:Tfp pilus assembly protein PilP
MTARRLLVVALLAALALPASPQAVAPTGTQAAPSPAEKKQAAAAPFSYSSGGRRDPFKDLLQGAEVRSERKVVGGLEDLAVDDIVLMGIIKSGGNLEAIISLSAGFPLTLHVGDKLVDGFVLSIEETQVVFRKTRDAKGLPLVKPRDVVKDIIAEEP